MANTIVDHLLLGAADLNQGIALVNERTGLSPVIGGIHPGAGTRNALLSLGDLQYLEIIAPDPAQQVFAYQPDLRELQEPRLITWAAATKDIDATAQKARAAGLDVIGPRDGSRKKPDGQVLHWKTLGIVKPPHRFRRGCDSVFHPVGRGRSASVAGCRKWMPP